MPLSPQVVGSFHSPRWGCQVKQCWEPEMALALLCPDFWSVPRWQSLTAAPPASSWSTRLYCPEHLRKYEDIFRDKETHCWTTKTTIFCQTLTGGFVQDALKGCPLIFHTLPMQHEPQIVNSQVNHVHFHQVQDPEYFPNVWTQKTHRDWIRNQKFSKHSFE